MKLNRFLASFLFILISAVLQYNLKAMFGWSPDFVLGTLITLSFFFGFIEILFISSAAAFLLNWQPYLGLEVLMLIVLPFSVVAVKKYFPWRIELNHLLSIFFALAVFYGISNYGPLFGNPALFLKSAGWTLVFAALVFQVFNYFYKTKEI